METKIIFNGKTYTKVEDMPEEIQQAYQQALAQFADADKNGIPDTMEGRAAGNVVAIQQSSITFNGREYKSTGEMPAIVRRLFEMAMAQTDANRNGIPDALETALGIQVTSSSARPESATAANASTANPSREREPIVTALAQTANALDTFLRVLLGIVAIATLAGAIFLILKIDGRFGSQGGRFYVAIVALLILGAIDSQFQKLVTRRQPFSLTTTEAEWRYAMVGLSLMLVSAVLLIGLAWFLP